MPKGVEHERTAKHQLAEERSFTHIRQLYQIEQVPKEI
jgi:hypothetical protein